MRFSPKAFAGRFTACLAVGVCLFTLACTAGGLAEPIALPPSLPTVTPLPTPVPLPTAGPPDEAPTLAVATRLPTVAPLEPATSLPEATLSPTAAPLATPTELPTAVGAEAAPFLPIPTAEPETPEPETFEPEPPAVDVGGRSWPVELAISPEDRQMGLSDRESLPAYTGMLFIFEGDQHLSFWMKDMQFPLDMVWIDSTCHVADVTLGAPPPEPGQEPVDLPRYRPESPARFVLEINAGEFEESGLAVGAAVRFEGSIAGEFGC